MGKSRDLVITEANRRFREAKEFWGTWRSEARDDFAFISGKQWLEDDERILEAQKRPPITFNYSEKMIDAVVGAEVSNRHEATFNPRGIEDAGLADLWNAAAKYVRGECDAEDEESDAFRDALICGMGWTHTRLDYDTDPDGQVHIERVDPLEMYPDPAASRAGLSNRRYHFRLYWSDVSEVRRNWPDAPMTQEGPEAGARGVITRGERYEDAPEDERERHQDQVQLRFYEWTEFEPLYRVQDPESGQILDMDQKLFDANKALIDSTGTPFAKQRKRVYYYAWFSGETLLEMAKSPCQEGWCYNAITAKRDRNRNTWYGLTRVMKDPQRWANKWLSQILHIINTNAKGGLMAEIGAFVDPTRAQDEWSQPDSVTLLNEGGLKKVKEKDVTPYPHGLDKLMEFALGSLPMVTGINLEALGLANRDQAGVLEAQRKQAAYGLLSPMFDALRRYRKSQARVLLYFIRTYLTDGRLVRIGGPENAQFVPLTKNRDAERYDIVIDQAPNAPDVKQRTWESLVQILPAAMKAGMPIPPDVLDFTPLPTALTIKWKQFATQKQQVDEQTQQRIGELEQENAQLRNDQQTQMLTLAQKQQAQEAEFELKRAAMQEEMRLNRDRAAAEFELERYRQERDMELEARRLEHEQEMRQRGMANDFKIKAFQQGVTANEDGNFSIGVDMGDMAQVIDALAQANNQAAQVSAQGNAAVIEAVRGLTSALSKPRRLITNQAGQPIGSTTVDNL